MLDTRSVDQYEKELTSIKNDQMIDITALKQLKIASDQNKYHFNTDYFWLIMSKNLEYFDEVGNID